MKATLPSVAAPDRCPWAIKAGTTLTTRCSKTAGHDGKHEGKGLAEFTYQRWDWLPGDRREFETDRVDEYAWDAEKAPSPAGDLDGRAERPGRGQYRDHRLRRRDRHEGAVWVLRSAGLGHVGHRRPCHDRQLGHEDPAHVRELRSVGSLRYPEERGRDTLRAGPDRRAQPARLVSEAVATTPCTSSTGACGMGDRSEDLRVRMTPGDA